MVRTIDISIFFTSQCCKHNSNNGGASLVRPTPKKEGRCPPSVIRARQWALNNGFSAIAETITIGNKHIGKLGIEKQYKLIKKRIREYGRFEELKYIYHFELQSNGNLHAHGIQFFGFQDRFITFFNDIGRHNMNDKSYQPVKDKKAYLDYINKENLFTPITNITKEDLK